MISHNTKQRVKSLKPSRNGGLTATNPRTRAINNISIIMAEGDTTTSEINNIAKTIDKSQSVTANGCELVASEGEGIRGVDEVSPDVGWRVELVIAVTSYPALHEHVVK